MTVVIKRPMKYDEFERETKRYHRPKSGMYCHCGADLNPHTATKVDKWTAESNGYIPCRDCFGGSVSE
jgi:ribosomal protein L34E